MFVNSASERGLTFISVAVIKYLDRKKNLKGESINLADSPCEEVKVRT